MQKGLNNMWDLIYKGTNLNAFLDDYFFLREKPGSLLSEAHHSVEGVRLAGGNREKMSDSPS